MNDHRHRVAEDEVTDRTFWDNQYLSKPVLWSGSVNPQLETEAADLAPGRALDVGCGEGGDSFWLAEHGWSVTGVDLSDVALDRARTRAAALGGSATSITWRQADLMTWTPEPSSFDLVSAHYVHLPVAARGETYQCLGDAVAPGGHLLVVAHHPDDPMAAAHADRMGLLFTAEQLVAELNAHAWDVLIADARPRDWRGSGDETMTRIDTVALLRRAQSP